MSGKDVGMGGRGMDERVRDEEDGLWGDGKEGECLGGWGCHRGLG